MKISLLYRWLAMHINRRWYLMLTLTMILCNISFGLLYAPVWAGAQGKAHILDMELGFVSKDVYTWLTNFGEAGRERIWGVTLLLDSIYPIVYNALLILLLVGLLEYSYPRLVNSLYKLTLFPLLTMVADWLENMCTLILIWAYPSELPLVVALGSVFNQLKWVSIVFSLAGVCIGLVAYYANHQEAKRELNEYK